MQRVIYIATSVPEDRPEYRRDLLSCFGYGPGTHIRFLYRKKWIAEKILAQFPAKGTQCVIVFCDRANENSTRFTFFALMRARWAGIEWQRYLHRFGPDDFLPVEFVLERPLMIAPADLAAGVSAWDDVILSQDDYPRPRGTRDAERARFVIERDELPREFPKDTTEDLSWLTLAQALSKTSSLQNCSFYRVKNITKVHGHVQVGEPIQPRSEGGIRVYRLRSDRTYRFNLQTLSTPGRVSIDRYLTPKVALSTLRFSQPFIASRGRTNQFHLLLFCPRTYAQQSDVVVFDAASGAQPDSATDAPSGADAKTTPQMEAAQAKIQAENAPRIEIPVIIGPPAWWELAGAIALLAVGVALVTPTPELLASDDLAWFPWLHAHAETALAVGRVTGALLATIGLYLGFRVTPSSRL